MQPDLQSLVNPLIGRALAPAALLRKLATMTTIA